MKFDQTWQHSANLKYLLVSWSLWCLAKFSFVNLVKFVIWFRQSWRSEPWWSWGAIRGWQKVAVFTSTVIRGWIVESRSGFKECLVSYHPAVWLTIICWWIVELDIFFASLVCAGVCWLGYARAVLVVPLDFFFCVSGVSCFFAGWNGLLVLLRYLHCWSAVIWWWTSEPNAEFCFGCVHMVVNARVVLCNAIASIVRCHRLGEHLNFCCIKPPCAWKARVCVAWLVE